MMIVEKMLNNAPNPLLHIADVSGSALFNADCMDILPLIPDKSVQLILADLPYGTTGCKWDSVIPLEPMWKEYKRIIKDNGAIVLTASQPFTTKLISSNYEMFKYCWTWDKVKPNGHLVAKFRPMQRTEDIVVFGYGKTIYNPQMIKRDKPKKSKEYGRTDIMGGNQTNYETRELNEKYPQSIIVISNANQQNKLHPTQKPLALMKYLILTYSNENDLVLDNTMGVGTCPLAAKELNRKFIGIEKEVKYYDLAVARVFG